MATEPTAKELIERFFSQHPWAKLHENAMGEYWKKHHDAIVEEYTGKDIHSEQILSGLLERVLLEVAYGDATS